SLPRRNPSPVAVRMTTDTIPHATPNIVSTLRSLWTRMFSTDCRITSRMGSDRNCGRSGRSGLRRQNDPVPFLQTVQHLHPGAVTDAELHPHPLMTAPRIRREDLHEGVLLSIVGHGGFGDEQRVRVLLEHNLRVRSHIGLQLVAGV